jgi:hypothetical protein
VFKGLGLRVYGLGFWVLGFWVCKIGVENWDMGM